jgi:thiol-disulfide isomerase/thioredoxin
LALFAALHLVSQAGRGAEIETQLPDGWKRTVAIPEVSFGGAVMLRESALTLWTEGGWLIVRRATADDDLEWQIVLARATDAAEPEVKIGERVSDLQVRYRDFFIRDAMGRLRVFREPKTEQSPAWPIVEFKGEPKQLGYSAGGILRGWKLDDWVWIQSGSIKDRPDTWLRLQHADLNTNGFGFGGFFGAMTYGKAQVSDEGDLLVASRGTFESAEQELHAKKLRDEFGTKSAPALAAKKWFNVQTPPAIEELRGKVVLLDFWATWCSPCVEKMPQVEALHQKFGKRGLVVIGVHSAGRSDKAGPFVKDKGITFPVLIDSGETARRYAVEAAPVYFLIDKSGKLVWGFSHNPPGDAQIEELLK